MPTVVNYLSPPVSRLSIDDFIWVIGPILMAVLSIVVAISSPTFCEDSQEISVVASQSP